VASFTVLGLMYDAWVDNGLAPDRVNFSLKCGMSAIVRKRRRGWLMLAEPCSTWTGEGARPHTRPRIYLIGNFLRAILLSAIGWTKLENADAI